MLPDLLNDNDCAICLACCLIQVTNHQDRHANLQRQLVGRYAIWADGVEELVWKVQDVIWIHGCVGALRNVILQSMS